MSAALDIRKKRSSAWGSTASAGAERGKLYRDRKRDGIRVPKGTLELEQELQAGMISSGLADAEDFEQDPLPMSVIKRALQLAVRKSTQELAAQFLALPRPKP